MTIINDIFTTLTVERQFPVLTVTLNRPHVANAMNLQMVDELMQVMAQVEEKQYRVLVLKGANGNFCSGGDIKDMQLAKNDTSALVKLNRTFGLMIETANTLPAVVVCLLQGAVLGGGLGLACISDVAIAQTSTKFALPETSLGIIPAQIAPFVVQRIGLTATRRMALLGLRIDANQALTMGLVHQLANDDVDMSQQLNQTIKLALKCAPNANQVTKALLHDVANMPMTALLDNAAMSFAKAISSEGVEGTKAFMQKRPAHWTTLPDD
ncbi:enoyl-CoA hydratase/isomerase family protein [Shewanella surugensis]|uniref:Enoyl-CoA hydratase-related protein n=1 Tax=Shewanella surugensis TaxID=212020 RepID=A0ABT0LDC6_9GAMM|nr:enoyl-CoA hydratase-related protein [Shewanella surugensis]MCL1125717.1 enoyl-CoA hydratase-related protein [Shewanella surugensis]